MLMIYSHVYKVTLLTICVKYECNAYNYASSNIIPLVVNVCLTIAILVKVLKSKWLEIIYPVKWWIFILFIQYSFTGYSVWVTFEDLYAVVNIFYKFNSKWISLFSVI